MKVKEFVVKQGWAIGYAEVRRAIASKSVLVNGLPAISAEIRLKPGDKVQFGKHKFATVEETQK